MSSGGSIIGLPPTTNPYLPGTIPSAVPSTPTGATGPLPIYVPPAIPPTTTLPTIMPTATAPVPVVPASPSILKKYWWVIMIGIVGLLYWQRKKVNKIVPWG